MALQRATPPLGDPRQIMGKEEEEQRGFTPFTPVGQHRPSEHSSTASTHKGTASAPKDPRCWSFKYLEFHTILCIAIHLLQHCQLVGCQKGSPSLLSPAWIYIHHILPNRKVSNQSMHFFLSRAPDLHVPLLFVHGVNCCCNNMLYHKQYSSSLC